MKACCPFCGHGASNNKRQQAHGERFFVECVGCGARGPISYTSRHDSIAKWTRRTAPPVRITGTPVPLDVGALIGLERPSR